LGERARATQWLIPALNSIKPHIMNVSIIGLFYADEAMDQTAEADGDRRRAGTLARAGDGDDRGLESILRSEGLPCF
jgi:hypothetical protein